ncbi:hypothetical protein Pint_30271 [Pistacia integerrima]|uniref:Uncharacterized protein n=1 Tax=Pistacia integerrima TaxID=434235 RepID=A0ACC0X2R6_9ROSI|nr:hypothetical protein Pint_30271 [Pistacia integerrima]
MAISSWLCHNSTKNMLVKVVHPGGHVELHDRPVLAAEIMLRNPRCIVAYPHVFKQPWAILAPDTTLTLGQKYYVVPVGTIRKLQRLSFKHSPSAPVEKNGSAETHKDMKHSGDNGEGVNKDGDARRKVSKDKCFMCLITRIKTKGNGEDSSEGTGSSSSSFASSETKGLTRKRANYFTRGSAAPNRCATIDQWQPNLEIISEE